MAWGHYHQIPYKSGLEEKILFHFSFRKLLWLAPGIWVAGQFNSVLPSLPYVDHMIFEKIHLLIPILISAAFAYIKIPKTNLTLFQAVVTYFKIRIRRRSFYYHRSNLPLKVENLKGRR
ncbi:hypothetical protein M3202_21485 [Alkalihalobacillus oceani]|uniref:Uncharacterized protein n=1 Tax=Halalkalibacter oceani TaxID=1653776 RepID=A0A9X2ISJ4_9BACI|nr:hypothetical protein [Halalkalibacter oceani]MCM3716618.1 hypothetical protein [Halalkalibacter oceani]